MSRREYRKFFSNLGFDESPFAYTNADEEDRLPQYFIPPPYFDSAFGNPDKPQSFIVFAPRGGGKTTQRRMIESQCVVSNVLAITYDQFEFSDIKSAQEITLGHHLRLIIRSLLIGLLMQINSKPEAINKLTKEDKQIFLKLSAEHLGAIKSVDLTTAINSLKGFKDKFKDFWNEWTPTIGLGLQAVVRLLRPIEDLGDSIANLSKFHDPEFNLSDTLKFQLRLLIDLSRKLEWRSVYILVDRVDESALTGNNVQDSFNLLQPLLRDLQLLEFHGIAFKFFLWDQLQPLCEDVVRTDRIKQEVLDWDDEMLNEMWEKRLSAFSNKKILRLQQISQPLILTVDSLCLIFANQSPRDLIRIGGQILDEHRESNPANAQIQEDSIYKALDKFCTKRASEVIRKEKVLNELKKIRQVDFTIAYLASQVFREAPNTTRNRMVRWRSENAIVDIDKIEDVSSKTERSVKLFAIKDIRVAKEIYPELSINDFLNRKYKKCPRCNATVLRDWGEIDSSPLCQDCQYNLMDKEQDEMEVWRRKQLAQARRKRYREETLSEDAIQLSLFDEIVE